jgi:hypothetical protein
MSEPATPAAPPWRPTHWHRNGNPYRVLMTGELETDQTPVVIYDDAAGRVWVRPGEEFFDGRFTAISKEP